MISVAQMRALFIVKLKPVIEVRLQRFQAGIHLFPHLDPEKFIQHRPVESLDKSVGLWMPYTGAAMLDVVQFQIQLIGVLLVPAELSAVIGQDIFNG